MLETMRLLLPTKGQTETEMSELEYDEEPGISDDLAVEEPYADPSQTSLFGDELTAWHEHWQGMPEFVQEDLSPRKSVIVHFETYADLAAFAKLVGQRLTPKTQSIWFPEAEIGRMVDKRFVDASDLEP